VARDPGSDWLLASGYWLLALDARFEDSEIRDQGFKDEGFKDEGFGIRD
jgi:hypothetical protein